MKPTPLSRTAYQRGDDPEHLTSREWLVTNALGGYASGSIGGVMTRRFHGLLVTALHAPLGRTMLFNQLRERVRLDDTSAFSLGGQEPLNGELELPTIGLESFRLEDGLPVWRHTYAGVTLEKRIFMPHLQNTTIVTYRLEKAPAPVELELSCGFFVRRHEGQFDARIEVSEHGEVRFPYPLEQTARGLELFAGDAYPCLRLVLQGSVEPQFVPTPSVVDLLYRVERSRGYDFHGPIFCPGVYRIRIDPGQKVTFFASTEAWSAFQQASADELLQAEFDRRRACRQAAHPALQDGLGAELVLAADQFVIIPRIRSNEEAQAQNRRRLHTVIAGYHWFTDWGRDTMISLEGLTLLTGRHDEARDILNTFAQHARNGLIPNLFPEGGTEGLYHTADASLWFFQALSRYERLTSDQETRRALLPKLLEIIDAHAKGTWFGIGVDPESEVPDRKGDQEHGHNPCHQGAGAAVAGYDHLPISHFFPFDRRPRCH